MRVVMKVAEVDAEATHDLRRRVLRGGRPDANVRFPEDARAGAFHLAVFDPDAGPALCVASFSPEPTPFRPARSAFRLRGMATDQAYQGRGLGRQLMQEAVRLLKERGAEVLWANARDTALAFYEGIGMEVAGEGFVTETGIPHHVVVLDL